MCPLYPTGAFVASGHGRPFLGVFRMHKKIFAAMCAIVEQPGYPLLKHYQQDLYKIDREMLEATWTFGMRYLWVVRENGTDLAILAMDARASDEARAILNRGGNQEIYLIDSTGELTLIDHATACEFAKKIVYHVNNGYIERDGKRIASMICNLVWVQRREEARVAIGTLTSPTPLDRAAFERIAISAAIKEANSLFISVRSLVIDAVETLNVPKKDDAVKPASTMVKTTQELSTV